MNTEQTVRDLKQYIRGKLNTAAYLGEIDGFQALAILQSLSAEFVSRIKCDERRQVYIDVVVQSFPDYVERERLATEHMTCQ